MPGSKDRKGQVRAATRALRKGGTGSGSSGPGQSQTAKDYRQLARAAQRPRPLGRNVVAAFFVGGMICVVGQGALTFWLARGLPTDLAVGLTAGTLVVLSALLTGLGVYDRIGEFGGMGSAIPITGFANSIVAPALEFKREGFVLGVGARMFTVAGPVIVYGLLTAIVAALIRLAVGA